MTEWEIFGTMCRMFKVKKEDQEKEKNKNEENCSNL